MWNTELESLVKGFNEYAKKVGDWDMKLLANSNKIYELHSEVQKVEVAQKRLDQNLEVIYTQVSPKALR